MQQVDVSCAVRCECCKPCCAAVIASDTTKAYVQCGSMSYWGIVLALVPLTAVVSAGAAVWLTRKYTAKTRAGQHLIKGEVRTRAFCFRVFFQVAQHPSDEPK